MKSESEITSREALEFVRQGWVLRLFHSSACCPDYLFIRGDRNGKVFLRRHIALSVASSGQVFLYRINHRSIYLACPKDLPWQALTHEETSCIQSM